MTPLQIGCTAASMVAPNRKDQRTRLAILLVLACLSLVGFAPTASAQATSLFFSEYVEGTSNNKALEIYNGTGAPVDLAAEGYTVRIYFNGNASPGTTVALTGTVADGDVYVLADVDADGAILAQADQTSTSNLFNGNDAVALAKNAALVDVIGQIGFDPGTAWGSGDVSTMDHTLRRRPEICEADPDGSDSFGPSMEWGGFATNTFDGLGAHRATCLAQRIELLETIVEAFKNHTHTYLTGKGAGHNNTPVQTGPANPSD
jgi:predicted extracellular nuclease